MDVRIKYSIVIVAIVIVAIAGYLIYSDVENSGTITIAGSTSVAPVAQALATAYMSNHPGVKISVSAGDSQCGYKRCAFRTGGYWNFIKEFN